MSGEEIADVSTAVGSAQRVEPTDLVPALTIVSHPTAHRAGEQYLLDAVVAGREISLSRNSPDFVRPGRALGMALGDPYISRRPIRFAPGPDGGVRVLADPEGTPMIMRSPLGGCAELTLDDLVQGVPIELADRVVVLLHMVDRTIPDTTDSLDMVGSSVGIRRVRRSVERLVDLAVPVLIRGETGTGKELVAHAIHHKGPHRDGPFVSVNLGALPRDLAAAELFGSTRGAYTGARDREGLFRAAHGGTLFLDEVGEAPPEIQRTLLRVIETGELFPVGAERPIAIQVRLITATDANLEDQIRQGHFKAPLLYRLQGYEVRLPTLRERREDIGPLFYHFAREELAALGELHRLAPQDPYAPPWLPAHLAVQLLRYHWPGNIRELRNMTRRLVIESRGRDQLRLDPHIEEQLGSLSRPANVPPRQPSDPAIEIKRPSDPAIETRRPSDPAIEVKRPSDPTIDPRRKASDVTEDELLDALRACAWDIKATAERLRIPRASIYDLIEKSPNIRTAGDLTTDEITQSFQTCAGNVDAMVGQLEVSRRALNRRLRELGLRASSRSSGSGTDGQP